MRQQRSVTVYRSTGEPSPRGLEPRRQGEPLKRGDEPKVITRDFKNLG